MANSIGLIESKGLVALIEAADVILKNSPVTILGIHKLENGLVSLAVSGSSDYVKAAVESGTEAGRRVGEIYASSVVDNPSKELLNLFSDLFPTSDVRGIEQDKISEEKINSVDPQITAQSIVQVSDEKKLKNKAKREKSKPLQITKTDRLNKSKKNTARSDESKIIKQDESLGQKIEEIKDEPKDKDLKSGSDRPLSTIERLRLEALGLKRKEEKLRVNDSIESDINNESKNESLKVERIGVDFEAIKKMNVHKLRHYAREFPNFPIKGREISRANRDELVQLFHTIDNQ
ncbi:MAG: BMC domain-containing protein [Ignavibacterium sp.]|jgi:microcompartment protein CcmL/EutN|nr:BMC domain-containing protein [Ignavibacterium sp.]